MKRKIVYWGATGLVAIVALLGGFSYVTNAAEAVVASNIFVPDEP